MTDTHPTRAVAVLGTGLIGAAIAHNLARKRFEVRAWNRSAEKARALAVDGVAPLDSAVEAVRDARIVVTVLKDGPAVEEAMAMALPNLRKGSVWLQLSTVGVRAISTISQRDSKSSSSMTYAVIRRFSSTPSHRANLCYTIRARDSLCRACDIAKYRRSDEHRVDIA